MKINRLLLFVPLMALASCFKEDEKIIPYNRGEKIKAAIAMTQTYKYQVYYSLADSQVVSSNLKTGFDLLFSNDPGGAGIYLNTSNFSQAAATGKYNLDEVTAATGLNYTYDASSGNPDSVVFKNWITFEGADTIWPGEVYVIDRGYDDLGTVLGYRKIIFDSLSGNRYYFRFSNLNGSGLQSAVVEKTGQSNYLYFSFDEGLQLFPEPPKTAYDLLFTQYTTLLFTNEGEPYPYLVTGVLLNRFATQAYLDTTLAFDSITSEHIQDELFTSRPDLIGYDWKEVLGDVNTGNVYYEIRPENNYFLKDQQGFYYKLRFISFYNNAGEKGYPTFEFQRL